MDFNKKLIVGIGLQKSGTTTLAKAMAKLGINGKQYSPEIISDEWHIGSEAAPDGVTFDLKNLNFDLFNEYSFTSDNPAPFKEVYQAIEQQFPNAKFILTTRMEEKWISSVKKHTAQQMYLDVLKYRRENYKGFDEQTSLIWSCDNMGLLDYLYSTPYVKLDDAAFSAKFRKHEAEVMEYFKDKPGKLLVINIDKGAGWKEICDFLNVPIPKERFPHSHTYKPSYVKRLEKFGKQYFPRFLKEILKKVFWKYVD